jgi:hypothetical protein
VGPSGELGGEPIFVGRDAEVGEGGPGPAAADHPDDRRGQDLTLTGGSDEAGRLDDRRPEDVALFEGDVPQSEADPDGERRCSGREPPSDGLLHGYGAFDRLGGGAEYGEDAVAEGLDLVTAMAFDCFSQRREVVPPHLIEGDVPEVGKKLGRPDEVGEHNRHRPTRPFTPHPEIVSESGASRHGRRSQVGIVVAPTCWSIPRTS